MTLSVKVGSYAAGLVGWKEPLDLVLCAPVLPLGPAIVEDGWWQARVSKVRWERVKELLSLTTGSKVEFRVRTGSGGRGISLGVSLVAESRVQTESGMQAD
jgi:hypothetical protein